jgi:hypothetical protein
MARIVPFTEILSPGRRTFRGKRRSSAGDLESIQARLLSRSGFFRVDHDTLERVDGAFELGIMKIGKFPFFRVTEHFFAPLHHQDSLLLRGHRRMDGGRHASFVNDVFAGREILRSRQTQSRAIL